MRMRHEELFLFHEGSLKYTFYTVYDHKSQSLHAAQLFLPVEHNLEIIISPWANSTWNDFFFNPENLLTVVYLLVLFFLFAAVSLCLE